MSLGSNGHDEVKGLDKIASHGPGEVRFERPRPQLRARRLSDKETGPDLAARWNVLRKRRWTVVWVFLTLFAIVLVGTVEEKPVYRAIALLEIERENPSLETPAELLQLGDVSDAYLETQYRILNSQDLAERIIHQLDLGELMEFRPPERSWRGTKLLGGSANEASSGDGDRESDPAFRETVLRRFQKNLDIKPVRRSLAVEIDFTSQDPELAVRVVDAVMAGYIQKNLQIRWDAAQKTTQWLSQQLGDLKAELEKSQDDLQKYAADNGLVFLESDKGGPENIVDQSLRNLQQELTRAETARYEKESQERLIQAGDYESLPGLFDDKLLQDLSERLAELERQRAQLEATFTENYPRVKETLSQIAELESALERERRRGAQKIRNDYAAAVRQENLLRNAFASEQKQANLIAAKSVQYEILRRDVDSNKSLYDGLLQRIKEAGVSSGLRASNIRIVDPAKASFQPVAPSIPLNLGLAVIVGLALGVCVAFVRESLDRTILNVEDVNRFLGTPALGFIPSLESVCALRDGGKSCGRRGYSLRITDPKVTGKRMLVISRPQNELGLRESAMLSESFRGLRTSVLLSGGDRGARSILVTSARPGEGKTTIAMNLAASLAQLGQQTLLIDADLRQPNLYRHFAQAESRLSSYLAGEAHWREMVHATPIPGLDVLLSGPPAANPAELLSSEAMRTLIREAAAAYSFVVLDSPSLLKVADSRILASMVDATVLVVNGGETPRQVVQYAESQARSAGANLLGVVVNNLDIRFTDMPYYDYTPSENRAV
jgi:capsular exopolysaccharide synthesis family protein